LDVLLPKFAMVLRDWTLSDLRLTFEPLRTYSWPSIWRLLAWKCPLSAPCLEIALLQLLFSSLVKHADFHPILNSGPGVFILGLGTGYYYSFFVSIGRLFCRRVLGISVLLTFQ
jgi:hypothetical protein